MTSSKFTQSLLVVVVLLLTWLTIRPYVSTTVVHASPPIQYKVERIQGISTMEETLNTLSNNGWELITCGGAEFCIFRK
jgi:hypothetical protein